MGLVAGRDFKARKHHDSMGRQCLTQCIDRCHAAMVCHANHVHTSFPALLKQCLVVGGFVYGQIGAPIGGMVREGINLQGAAPETCVHEMLFHDNSFMLNAVAANQLYRNGQTLIV
ncbi:hypothetical protein [Pseudomonas putida]|uniref:hypothetical protein n=1 Tax=Pseudomonas putida TaxID=303 RepID=UPI001F3671DD|nr:hypothetical protein [Pseudomonas putida]